MIKKIVLCIIGFGSGLFMLLNGIVIYNKYLDGSSWSITPGERLYIACITFIVGLLLVLWTYLLIKKKR